MPTSKKHPDRAAYGSLAGEPRLILSVPPDLRAAARTCAESEGVSEAEWWRRAGRERALRQASGDPALQTKLLGE